MIKPKKRICSSFNCSDIAKWFNENNIEAPRALCINCRQEEFMRLRAMHNIQQEVK